MTENVNLVTQFNALQAAFDKLESDHVQLEQSLREAIAEKEAAEKREAQLWKRLKSNGTSPKSARSTSPSTIFANVNAASSRISPSPSRVTLANTYDLTSSPRHLTVPEELGQPGRDEPLPTPIPISTAPTSSSLSANFSIYDSPPPLPTPLDQFIDVSPIPEPEPSREYRLADLTPQSPFAVNNRRSSEITIDGVILADPKLGGHTELVGLGRPSEEVSHGQSNSSLLPSYMSDTNLGIPTKPSGSTSFTTASEPAISTSPSLAALNHETTPFSEFDPNTPFSDHITLSRLNNDYSTLTSALVPFTAILVIGSSIKITKGKESPSITLEVSITLPSDPTTVVNSWRVNKCHKDLEKLDDKLHKKSKLGAILPDKALFKDHGPSKIDERTSILNNYFEIILQLIPISDVLLQFLNTDILLVETSSAFSGWLTKKARNFGGNVFQTRYYRLSGDSNSLDCYDSNSSSTKIIELSLKKASIGRQSAKSIDTIEYRHAFLIRTSDGSDHVFSADSDENRDAWVKALMKGRSSSSGTSNGKITTGGADHHHAPPAIVRSRESSMTRSESSIPPSSRSTEMLPPALPARPIDSSPIIPPRDQLSPPNLPPRPPSASRTSSAKNIPTPSSLSTTSVSVPSNGTPLPQEYNFKGGDKESKKVKTKSSFWGFNKSSSSSSSSVSSSVGSHFPPATLAQSISNGSNGSAAPSGGNSSGVFGVSLKDAVAISKVKESNLELPAVVFRCIEFLTVKEAKNEEGIFRLSGSVTVISKLKERFNNEHDVNLLIIDEDIHAVAGLLKAYLRDLPSHILTKELRSDFVNVVELEGEDRFATLRVLLDELPIENLTLIRYLFRFLSSIAQNCDRSQMTVRNLGIVFSPTLKLPAPLFTMLLDEFADPEPDEAIYLPPPPSLTTSTKAQRRSSFRPPDLNIISPPSETNPPFALPSAMSTSSLNTPSFVGLPASPRSPGREMSNNKAV